MTLAEFVYAACGLWLAGFLVRDYRAFKRGVGPYRDRGAVPHEQRTVRTYTVRVPPGSYVNVLATSQANADRAALRQVRRHYARRAALSRRSAGVPDSSAGHGGHGA